MCVQIRELLPARGFARALIGRSACVMTPALIGMSACVMTPALIGMSACVMTPALSRGLHVVEYELDARGVCVKHRVG